VYISHGTVFNLNVFPVSSLPTSTTTHTSFLHSSPVLPSQFEGAGHSRVLLSNHGAGIRRRNVISSALGRHRHTAAPAPECDVDPAPGRVPGPNLSDQRRPPAINGSRHASVTLIILLKLRSRASLYRAKPQNLDWVLSSLSPPSSRSPASSPSIPRTADRSPASQSPGKTTDRAADFSVCSAACCLL
jgi:hypothetical protein